MEKIKIIFSYNGSNTIIQSEKNKKLKDIYKSFINKVKAENKLLYYVYNGNNIQNDKLTFDEIANSEDKIRNEMNILVNELNQEEQNSLQTEYIIKSKEIICPECKENIKFKFEDYIISLYECKNNHDLDLFIDKFNMTQKIDLSKIICQNCKIYNKGNVHDNTFYKCNTCKLNLCPICYFNHDKNHNIINYDDKNYICEEHNNKYIAYCKDCKQNICIFCEQNHKNDNLINYGLLIPNIDNINNDLNQLKLQKNKLINEIKEIINKLNKVIENFDIYYNINENLINNYDKNKMNYEILYNLNNINNDVIIKDIENIINDNNIQTKFNKVINIYNKMNNNTNTNIINEGEVYYIQSRFSGKVVDLDNAETDNGTNIHLWTLNKTNAQKFKAVKNDCYYSFLSACDESKALDVRGNNFNIEIWDYSKENDNQKWKLKKIEDEWYALICKGNNGVMDVYGSLLDDGTNIFCCKEKLLRPNQQFRLINVKDSFFDSSILSNVNFSCTIRQGGCTISNIHQNMVVDAASENNGCVQLWNKLGLKHQKWDFIRVGPDTYYIRNCAPYLNYPFIYNDNSGFKYKLFDGKMGDEYKWKLYNQGKKLNKDSFLIQNIKTKYYLDSGGHDNHVCGGRIYTYLRCGVEQIFLLAGEEDI